jgi:hypothetical protein
LRQALSARAPAVALQKHNLPHGVAIADLSFRRISLAGAETVLYPLGGADDGLCGNGDGAQPMASLRQGGDSIFYGTKKQVGARSAGSQFMRTKVVPAR